MHRVTIVGGSGSGKSTLAETLSTLHDARLVELDALFHQPGWKPTPTPDFRAKVAAALDTERWVVAGNYSVVMDITQGGADTIIWLDMPRWLVTLRVARRSVKRAITGEELWNGNREHWRTLLSRDPEINVIVWAWTHHRVHTARYEGFMTSTFWEHATVHRLRSRRDVKDFLASSTQQ